MAKPISYCTIEGCNIRCHGKGLCNKHYRNMIRTGSPISNKYLNRNKYIEKENHIEVIVKNGSFIVDKEDIELVKKHYWAIDNSNGYVTCRVNRKKVYLHRLLTKPKHPLVTDHINRNKLDNRKSNLRVVSRSVNNMNRQDRVIKHQARYRRLGVI